MSDTESTTTAPADDTQQSSAAAAAFSSQDGDAALAAFAPDAFQAEQQKKAAEAKKIDLTLDLLLVEAIVIGKETITTLQLTEPTMKQLRNAQRAATPLEQLSILIQLNTGKLPAVIDKLKQRDINAIDAFFGQFSRA